MDPILGTLGVFILVASLIVFVHTNQHNKNPAATPIPWEKSAAAIAVLGAIGGAMLTLGLQKGGSVNVAGEEESAPTETRYIAPSSTPTPTPTPGPTVTFVKPAGNDTFPICSTASGSAELDDDQDVVVGAREPQEDRWYFETDVRYNPARTRWNVRLQLGDTDATKKERYDLVALVMTKAEAEYLRTTQTELDESGELMTYWSSPRLPPNGVLGSKQISITRLPDGSDC